MKSVVDGALLSYDTATHRLYRLLSTVFHLNLQSCNHDIVQEANDVIIIYISLLIMIAINCYVKTALLRTLCHVNVLC